MGSRFHTDRTLRRLAVALAISAPLAAQTTQRTSVGAAGVQGNAESALPAISADGRFVVFLSASTNLVPNDSNHQTDVFVRDRDAGTTERVSVSSARAQANDRSNDPSITPDGRFVVFESFASTLVAGDTNSAWDVFVRDRQLGTTERVSLASNGSQGNDDSSHGSITADGRFVVFHSRATNLAANDASSSLDVFVRDRQLGTTALVSVSTGGTSAGGESPRIAAGGRYVVFESGAANLVAGDTNAQFDVFVRDLQSSATTRASVGAGGAQANFASGAGSISADGRFVAFRSVATNLVAGDANGVRDVFVRDRVGLVTTRESLATAGTESDGDSDAPSISADGSFVVFESAATDLVAGDTNGARDVFLRDRSNGTTERVDLTSAGAQASLGGVHASVSADARFVAFESESTALVPWDTNGSADAYVRDRTGGFSYAHACSPGVDGVVVCPCGNSPTRTERGCDNSAHTGGAELTASGATCLSSDSLVFHTTGEKPTATSVLLQGTTQPAAGVVYGQGVRCVGGTLKRLFAKAAVAGSVTIPNFGAGDATVSARSAAKGNVIGPGQVRTYLVFYRDPTVLGGCPSSSTFNATQTGVVTWSP